MAIPQSFVQELLARVDVVEVVGRYVQLKKGGANFMGLCPFHGEKSPSFSVSPSKQFYHCFGCGKNGNAVSFLMEHTGAGFREAVQDLAQQVGLTVPDDDSSPEERQRASEQRQRQATLNDVLEKAGESWRQQLKQSSRAIDYCKRRGLSGQVAKRFGLGYAPEGWRNLASVFPHYDDPLLVDSGLVILNTEDAADEKRYDRFRDRLMFPIRNVKGECIGFGGRVLGDEKPKYLNSPETPVFSKGRELYGLYEARDALREAGYVLVTEGYMDVVALAQLGFPNAVATLGTACTPDHVHKLFRFTDTVVFSFDGDAAGRRAARKALEGALPYATDVRSVKFLFLPAEHDPDSYIRAHGQDAFALCVGDAVPLSRFLIDVAREGCDLQSAEGRAHLASNAKPLWSQLPDGALKRQLLGDIAELVQLDPRELGELWEPKAAPAEARPRRKPSRKDTGGERAYGSRTRLAARPSIDAYASHVATLVLRNTSLWEGLNGADHDLLCSLEGPYGDLFRWTDQQVHEHGPQPWAALDIGIQEQPFEAIARRLVAQDGLQPMGRVIEIEDVPLADVRATLVKLHLDVINEELKRLRTLPPSDPARIGQERELILRQFAVRKASLS
ncbi:DNA primase [Pseudorhodoferax sp. Leaf267]|uniref:DNA primase n=1 Tax=Pseudorhodoferax sp. Leaf267 TaxID=1736316 RepID=UPI0006F95C7F|nr:DNA primase [Pseudorhodoferax sp. Leaf267]KQP18201.1 DNA primase [Pseudorhodoferax sp. Leaf267]